jgi:Carbohydrate-binding module 48 (Isoamylase N-terminal domain)
MTNPAAVPRSIARLQYAVARLPFTLLDEGIIARHWGRNALARRGLQCYLGSLDLFAGWLLADDEISRRGQALIRGTRYPARDGAPAGDAPSRLARAGQVRQAGEQDREMPDTRAAHQEQHDQQHIRPGVGGPVAAASAPPIAEETPAAAAGQPGPPGTPASKAGTIDVTFTLPAEVHAGTVALCGEFNNWSAEDIWLQRGSDGSWRATVALEPGRSYRYRYLLDGERWENAWQADCYAPNSYGSADSVIVAGPPAHAGPAEPPAQPAPDQRGP